jgi:hypothetical protein
MWSSDYPFTPAELRRLAVYRTAVRAGFYSEWPPSKDDGHGLCREQVEASGGSTSTGTDRSSSQPSASDGA